MFTQDEVSLITKALIAKREEEGIHKDINFIDDIIQKIDCLQINELSVVVTGNLFDGLTVYGPIHEADAAEWAESKFETDWRIVSLESPFDYWMNLSSEIPLK